MVNPLFLPTTGPKIPSLINDYLTAVWWRPPTASPAVNRKPSFIFSSTAPSINKRGRTMGWIPSTETLQRRHCGVPFPSGTRYQRAKRQDTLLGYLHMTGLINDIWRLQNAVCSRHSDRNHRLPCTCCQCSLLHLFFLFFFNFLSFSFLFLFLISSFFLFKPNRTRSYRGRTNRAILWLRHKQSGGIFLGAIASYVIIFAF